MDEAESKQSQSLQANKARNVFAVVLALNLAIAAGKLVWGFHSQTLSMLADGFHSLLDASANILAIVGLSISFKPADTTHPYGHRKVEALAAVGISFFMFLASFEVLGEAVHRLFSTDAKLPVVGAVSYGVMFITILTNIFVARFENRKAKQLGSKLLGADVKHTFSDLLSSIAVITTLIAVQLKMPWFDTFAAMVIVVIIFKAGLTIIMDHLGTLVDAAILDPGFVEKLVLEVPGVTSCHKIRSRGMRDHIFLDLHIQVPGALSIEEAHRISYQVEEKLLHADGGIADVVVHVEEDGHAFQIESSGCPPF